MFKDYLKKKVLEDPDFIKCVKHGNSLYKYMSANHGTIKDKTIARLLMINEAEVEEIYQEAVEKLKKGMT